MYKKIIVPLDGSKLAEQILPYARALARGLEIPVDLLCVNDPDQIIPYLQQRQVDEYLKTVAARYFGTSFDLDFTVNSGNPAEIIVDHARAVPGSLIAMATHGVSGIHRWLLGSVASKVVQSATRPMLVVRPVEEEGDTAKEIQLKSIVVPLDGSGLAEKILPQVKVLAETLGLEVSLLRVYAIAPESYIVGDGLYMDTIARGREAIRKEAEDYLSGVTQHLQAEGVGSVSSIAAHGDAAQEIIGLARQTPDCLIAMSTHGRSGMGRWVLGSVAEKVIHHSKDPVLVIRPA